MYRRIVRRGSEKPVVEPLEATKWIRQNVVGYISKKDLDLQRNDEINNSDFMANQNIIYHIESILEMQFICLILVEVL